MQPRAHGVEFADAGGGESHTAGPRPRRNRQRPAVPAWLDRTLDVSVEWRVDGLQEAIARVDGSATIALGSEFRDWFRPVTYHATFTIDASVELSVRTIDRVPTAGSVAIELDYRRSRSDGGETAHYQFPIEVSIADGVARFTLGGSEIIVDL